MIRELRSCNLCTRIDHAAHFDPCASHRPVLEEERGSYANCVLQ